MKTKLLCDGTSVEYLPEYVEEHCETCGHPTAFRVVNEPDFHGKAEKRDDGKYYCTRCGERFVGLAEVAQIVQERLLPWITQEIFRTSPFYALLKKGGQSAY